MDLAVSVESTFSPMILRRFNTWYSINDGNWSDSNTWVSNALDKKTRISPQPGDNVYINHTVTLDTTIAINNIYISGTLKADNSSRILTVNGDLQAVGSVDFTSSNVGLVLNGYNNFITSFTCGAASTVCYSATMTQYIMPVTYFNLEVVTTKIPITKYMQADLVVNGHLYLGTILDTKNFNITTTGVTSVNGAPIAGACSDSTILSTANMTFIGAVQAGVGRGFTVTGAASIECRGGISVSNGWCAWNTANINFTTNNQTLSGGGSGNGVLTCNNITITGAITVNTNSTNTEAVILLGVMNGTVAGSTFNNNGWLKLTNSTLPMATGVYNYNNNVVSTTQYTFNGNYTLPFTSYSNLMVDGTGTKSISGDITISGTLTLTALLDLTTFNYSCSGSTTLKSITGQLNKSGAGSVLFIGQVMCQTGSVSSSFSGNPTVEFRGGINHSNGSVDFGTGATSFTTNNQNITCISAGNNITFNGNVTIASGITVTRVSDLNTTIFNGTLDGASGTSNFTNKGVTKYQNATAPMVTGLLYCNQATNTWHYSLNGNQDITVPSDPTPGYSNLTLSTGGAKKLLGNVSVKGVYTLSAPATLNSNGFALTNP